MQQQQQQEQQDVIWGLGLFRAESVQCQNLTGSLSHISPSLPHPHPTLPLPPTLPLFVSGVFVSVSLLLRCALMRVFLARALFLHLYESQINSCARARTLSRHLVLFRFAYRDLFLFFACAHLSLHRDLSRASTSSSWFARH